MPCRKPTDEAPHQCNKLAVKGEGEPHGNDHVWPTEGVLLVSRCEVYCQFCWESKGSTRRWKFPWHLRRHVRNVHAEKTHPNLICPKGWKESATGNRKPWQEEGVPAPMGNYKDKRNNPATTPKATATSKPPKTPERNSKRQAQKKKRASKMATPTSDTRETTPTPSTPALTDDELFSTPADQLLDSISTPSEGRYNLANNTMTPASHDNTVGVFGDSKLSLNDNVADIFGPELATALNDDPDTQQWHDVMPTTEGAIGPFMDMNWNWNNTTHGLPLPTNPTLTSFGAIDSISYYDPATGFAFARTYGVPFDIAQRPWVAEQMVRIDGTTVDPVAPQGAARDAAEDLVDRISEAVYDSIALGKLSEGEALYVLQSFTNNFKAGGG